MLFPLFATLFTIISLGLSILFSLTYSSISLIKGIPYFVAFPFPTPEIFEISSIVIGYILLISISDGSEKIIDGGREILIASFFLRSLSKRNKFLSKDSPF